MTIPRIDKSEARFVPALLTAAFVAAVISTRMPAVAYILIVLALTVIALKATRVSVGEVVLLSSAFMFFPPGVPTLNVAVSDFVFPFLVLVLIARYQQTDERTIQARADLRQPAIFAAAFLILITTLTLIDGLQDPNFILRYAFIDLMKTFVVLGYFIAISAMLLVSSKSQVYRAMKLWVWLTSALSAGSLVGIVPSDGYRSLGFFQDPNLYAGYLLVSLALAFTLVAERQLTLWPILVVLLLAGILSTGSRGGIISTCLVVIAALMGIALTRVGVAITTVAVALVSILLLAPWQDWVRGLPGGDRLLTSSQAGSDPRLNLWEKAIELGLDNPLAGVGIGQFPRFSAGLTPFHRGVDGQVAHNTYLSLFAETGVLGLGLFLLGIYVLVKRILTTRDMRWSTRWSILLGLVAIGATMLTINLQNLRYVWIYAAIAWAMTSCRGPFATQVVSQPSQLTGAGSRPVDSR